MNAPGSAQAAAGVVFYNDRHEDYLVAKDDGQQYEFLGLKETPRT
jgi:hypothetical protein